MEQTMFKAFGRRHVLRFAWAVPAFALTRKSYAAGFPAPTGKSILELSGKITNFNDGGVARFDRAMLEGLGMTSFQTNTPWYTGPVTFEGVRMTTLLETVGASGEQAEVIALNDYTTEIPITDFGKFDVIMALKRDGVYMPVRDKGPLFIVYPYDSRAELRQQKYYSRSAWQVAKIIVK
jgi:hypothetical protein